MILPSKWCNNLLAQWPDDPPIERLVQECILRYSPEDLDEDLQRIYEQLRQSERMEDSLALACDTFGSVSWYRHEFYANKLAGRNLTDFIALARSTTSEYCQDIGRHALLQKLSEQEWGIVAKLLFVYLVLAATDGRKTPSAFGIHPRLVKWRRLLAKVNRFFA